uniref:THAP-type domain-containing protein n=1 Tax=Lepeophtheirus salmonis TaxID=72036 RepID=A0A0K2U3P0_LEPSM
METKRLEIASLIHAGFDASDIVKQLGVSRHTIYRVRKRLEDGSSLKDRPRSGRPVKLTPEAAKHALEANPTMSMAEFAKKNSLHRSTVSKVVKAAARGKSKRKDHQPNINSRVCRKHFEPTDYKVERTDPSPHRKIPMNLTRRLLKNDAVPSIFEESPSIRIMNKSTPKSIRTSSSSDIRLQNGKMPLVKTEVFYFKEEAFSSLLDIENTINISSLPPGSHLIIKEDSLLFCFIDDETIPQITQSLKIFDNLTFKLYHQNTIITQDKVKHICKSEKIESVCQIENLLAFVKSLEERDAIVAKSKLEKCIQILNTVECEDNHIKKRIDFIAQQLDLVVIPKKKPVFDFLKPVIK